MPHYYGEQKLPCHMRVDWEGKDVEDDIQFAPHCEGFLIFMKNTFKLPRNPRVASLVSRRERNDAVFDSVQEFVDYHGE